jgi:hypothetical protein
MLDDPCRLRQVIIVHIWLDFYEDDMLPWFWLVYTFNGQYL